jgi:hypothetical protein
MRSDPAGSEQFLAIVIGYLESTDRGDSPDTASLLAKHPALAPEFHEFVNTYAWLQRLTASVRGVVQASRAGSATAFAVPSPGGPSTADRCENKRTGPAPGREKTGPP